MIYPLLDSAKEKPAQETISSGPSLNNPGDFLLSHAVTRAVPSAPTGLTSVFGMGTGVTLSTKSPENLFEIPNLRSQISNRIATALASFHHARLVA
jgi:hypothetical protein